MINVLDHGSIELINHMGNDREIAETAWVSTGRCENREDWEVERVVKYMATHDHWTALAQTTIKVRISWPLFVARQAMRSNVGIVWNEESRRHMADAVLLYFPDQWFTKPDDGRKQGRGLPLSFEMQEECKRISHNSATYSVKTYSKLLDLGTSFEEARLVLPVNMYTSCIVSFSLVSAARFCSLRLDPNAQWEIQQYAQALSDIIEPLFPIAWKFLMQAYKKE